MINLNMPDFDLGLPAYEETVGLCRSYPEIVNQNTRISAIFGCFKGAIWNGGGTLIGGSESKDKINDVIHFYNDELHIPLRFTFTNSLISTNQCFDTYCNIIAECGHNGQNEILTSSPILEAYLRKTYPNYKFCRSIIAAESSPYGDTSKYDLVVMRRNMNNQWDFLSTIPFKDRGKIEFLCCDPCPDNCPRIYTHYRDFARAQIEQTVKDMNVSCSMQHIKGPFISKYAKSLNSYITFEDIQKKYYPLGFNQFKISGRTNIPAIIQGITDYLIKPEYRDDITAYLINAYLK